MVNNMIQNHENIKGCKGGIPTRFAIALMIFSASLFNYMLRVNMSINLIAMAQPTKDSVGKLQIPECTETNNETRINFIKSAAAHDYGVRYSWDQQTQGLILGAYFWGYFMTQIPGGLLAEKWGSRQVIGWAGVLSAILTILTPFFASLHYSVVIFTRLVLGLVNGMVFPALHCLISQWVPPNEKGKFAVALLGGNLGTVATWPILGTISEHWGWVWAFYLPGILCLLWACFWFYFVYDTPKEHPRILDEEKKFIMTSLGGTITKSKIFPPYRDIFLSVPFWAIIVLHFGHCWGMSFLLTMGPKYLAEVLGFNLSQSGELAALPHLARMIMAFFFGSIGDIIRRKQCLSVTGIRKWFVIFSHFLPGVFLVVQTFVGCNVILAIVIITLSLGFNGACALTNIQNNQDLAPNFAGTLYGIINCVGSVAGVITPILTGYITQEHNGLDEWRIVFIVGAVVYIASGIVFCIFGSGEIQPWNEIQSNAEENTSHIHQSLQDSQKGMSNTAFVNTESCVESTSNIKHLSENKTTEVTRI